MAQHDDVRQLSPPIERFPRVIVHWDGLNERAEVSDVDVGIGGSSAASCVEEEDGFGGGYDLCVDEGVFIPDVVPFVNEEGGGGESSGCEGGEMGLGWRWCWCIRRWRLGWLFYTSAHDWSIH